MKEIYLAGGCFWGVERGMSLLNGVVSTECGYANGDPHLVPDYLLVCSGRYGYAETVRVEFDPDLVSVPTLLKAFFMMIDPTKVNRQGNDIGIQYRTGIFWKDEHVGKEVVDVIGKISGLYPEFHTEVMPLINFTPAEENHQKYLEKNPRGYCHIPPSVMSEIQSMNRK